MKNIIFDFGGVLLNIDYSLTENAFRALGFTDFTKIYSQNIQQNLFDKFEKGELSEMEFFEMVRGFSGIPLKDSEILIAWNAMLINLPEACTTLLEKLKMSYRIFLLSNTNSIHEKEFTRLIEKSYGIKKFYALFEKTYFSHHMGMRKPDVQIFNKVIEENNLLLTETIFLDDSMQHIEGAKKAGLQTQFVEKGENATDYFR